LDEARVKRLPVSPEKILAGLNKMEIDDGLLPKQITIDFQFVYNSIGDQKKEEYSHA